MAQTRWTDLCTQVENYFENGFNFWPTFLSTYLSNKCWVHLTTGPWLCWKCWKHTWKLHPTSFWCWCMAFFWCWSNEVAHKGSRHRNNIPIVSQEQSALVICDMSIWKVQGERTKFSGQIRSGTNGLHELFWLKWVDHHEISLYFTLTYKL